jgi:hypothetical protein
MKSHQAVDVTEVVPTFFAQSGLSEYDSTTIKPNGYTLQGDNCHVYFSSPDLSATLLSLTIISQIVTIPVAPGAKIQAEPGTMCFAVRMPSHIPFPDLSLA